MNRTRKLLKGLDLSTMVGLEIGALDRPIVRKSDGRVIYVDYMDTDGLRARYRETAEDHDWTKIVEVDAVWGEKTIAEAIGPDVKVDYVIASHVGEHVPDLVTWLSELVSVLKPGGTIRLALPDKRFCFDHLREETRLVDVLTAHVTRARVPQPQQVIDFCLHFSAINARDAWRGSVDRPQLRNRGQLDHAFTMAKLAATGVYVDVHCWAFTASSFAEIMEQLAGLSLLRLDCQDFVDTEPGELEFFVTMRRTEDDAAPESWRKMADATRPTPAIESEHQAASRTRRLKTGAQGTRIAGFWRSMS